MSKYEVWVTVWSEENKSQIKIVAGTFCRIINAKIFEKAYTEHFSSAADTPAAAPAPAAPTPAADTPAPALLLPKLDPIVYTPDEFAAMIAA